MFNKKCLIIIRHIMKRHIDEILRHVQCIQSPSSITTLPVKIELLNIGQVFFRKFALKLVSRIEDMTENRNGKSVIFRVKLGIQKHRSKI